MKVRAVSLLLIGSILWIGGCGGRTDVDGQEVAWSAIAPDQEGAQEVAETAPGQPVDTRVEEVAETVPGQPVDTRVEDLSEIRSEQASPPEKDIAEVLREDPGRLMEISQKDGDRAVARLDVDGDGRTEEICLAPSEGPDAAADSMDPLLYHHLQVGDAVLEGSGKNMADRIWAVSLDGNKILIVLYEDGPSADPYTHFYRYEVGRLCEAGGFACDIRQCSISRDGIITGTLRRDTLQTDWVTVQWELGAHGSIEEIPQESYDLQNGNWVEMNEALPLHPAAGSADTFMVGPQGMRFLKVSSDDSWVLAETQDGQQGWLHVRYGELIDLDKSAMELFTGLNLVD